MDLIQTGLLITFFGMGLVFLLLVLLWGLMAVLLRLDRPSAAQEEQESVSQQPAGADLGARAPAGLEPEKLAAIAIADLTHRAVRRKQAAPAMRSHWPGTLLDASRWVAAGRTRQNRAWQSRQE
jgi:Na+-transporting methylmalonyl-CoA/oxaloacetate decarboxylase gamma subunit